MVDFGPAKPSGEFGLAVGMRVDVVQDEVVDARNFALILPSHFSTFSRRQRNNSFKKTSLH
jgi:hypothetical protein